VKGVFDYDDETTCVAERDAILLVGRCGRLYDRLPGSSSSMIACDAVGLALLGTLMNAIA